MSPLHEACPVDRLGEPARIVSLVPSITESLFVLGLGERVIGVTDWCVYPAEAVAALPKLGGTKDPDIAAIAALAPDLVIANHEENTKRVVNGLVARGLEVWVTYPRTVQEGALLLDEIARLGASETARREVVAPVLEAVDGALRASRERADRARPRVFCPIWRDPWMVPGPDTYAHDLLALCGGHNVGAEVGQLGSQRGAAKPRGSDRYPRLTLDDLVSLQPDVVLLPDEPYAFGPKDAAEISSLDLPAAREARIHLIDGTWVSWYGPRIRPAIQALQEIFPSSPP